jgi:D-arabinose 1-dehydrogenase-like Zn-dependent alcohol dehydrogenase
MLFNYNVQEMLKFCADYDVYPVVETFEFEDFPKAFETLEKGRPKFRCVVNVSKWAKLYGLHK